jgi:hypothetical protein
LAVTRRQWPSSPLIACPWLPGPTTSLQSLMSYAVYYWQGKIGIACPIGREAINVAEESGDMHSKSAAYVAHGVACYGKGFLEAASKQVVMGIDFSEKSNLLVWNALGQHFMGEMCFESGNYQKAEYHFGKSSRLSDDCVWMPSWTNIHKL